MPLGISGESQGSTYRIHHSPKSRRLCFVSEPPHDYLHRRPAPLDCSGRSPAAWVLRLQGQQPCPPPCSHNSQIQRHRADLRLWEGKQNPPNQLLVLSNEKAGQDWNEDDLRQWAHIRSLQQRNLTDCLRSLEFFVFRGSCILLRNSFFFLNGGMIMLKRLKILPGHFYFTEKKGSTKQS